MLWNQFQDTYHRCRKSGIDFANINGVIFALNNENIDSYLWYEDDFAIDGNLIENAPKFVAGGFVDIDSDSKMYLNLTAKGYRLYQEEQE